MGSLAFQYAGLESALHGVYPGTFKRGAESNPFGAKYQAGLGSGQLFLVILPLQADAPADSRSAPEGSDTGYRGERLIEAENGLTRV